MLQAWLGKRFPQQAGDSDFVYRQAIRAKALDALRGLLPAATLSNVGIYGTGQSYEMLLLRMRAHPLPEARRYAELMLDELRKVIPSFLQRGSMSPNAAERGRSTWPTPATAPTRWWSRRGRTPAPSPAQQPSNVRLVDFDPEGEDKVIAAMCYPLDIAARRRGPPAGAGARGRGATGDRPRPMSATGPTAVTDRAGPSSAPPTGSTWCRTTGRSATCSATGC